MEEVKQLLKAINLECYSCSFEEQGYDDMDVLIDLSEEELNDAMLHIGVTKPGHRLKIRISLKIERNKRNNPPPEDTKADGINVAEEESQSCKCLFIILKV